MSESRTVDLSFISKTSIMMNAESMVTTQSQTAVVEIQETFIYKTGYKRQ